MFWSIPVNKQPETIQELAGRYPSAVGDPKKRFNFRLAPKRDGDEGPMVTHATLYPRREEGAQPGEVVAQGFPEGSSAYEYYRGSTAIVNPEALWPAD